MATRNVTYQFEGYFATYDRETEQEQIEQIEQAHEYIGKFDVNLEERDLIDEGHVELTVENDELILRGE